MFKKYFSPKKERSIFEKIALGLLAFKKPSAAGVIWFYRHPKFIVMTIAVIASIFFLIATYNMVVENPEKAMYILGSAIIACISYMFFHDHRRIIILIITLSSATYILYLSKTDEDVKSAVDDVVTYGAETYIEVRPTVETMLDTANETFNDVVNNQEKD